MQGTTNFDLGGDTIQETTFQPYETKTVARISQLRRRGGFKLKFSWNVGTKPPDDSVLQAECVKHEERVTQYLQKLGDLSFPHHPAAMPLHSLISLLKTKRVAFIDRDFLPTPAHIAPARLSNPYGRFATWRRCVDFFDGSPQLYVDGIDALDIEQGLLGNCWFCSGLACMAEHPDIVSRAFVAPDDNKVRRSISTRITAKAKASNKAENAKRRVRGSSSSTKDANMEVKLTESEQKRMGDADSFECGVYRVRVCKDGTWRTITLDDFFPCFPMQVLD